MVVSPDRGSAFNPLAHHVRGSCLTAGVSQASSLPLSLPPGPHSPLAQPWLPDKGGDGWVDGWRREERLSDGKDTKERMNRITFEDFDLYTVHWYYFYTYIIEK